MTTRSPRRLALIVCVLIAAAAAFAGVMWTPLAFLALPFAIVAGYAMWLGLRNEELLDALDQQSQDPGTGPVGLH